MGCQFNSNAYADGGAVAVTIDAAERHQHIEGFGASGAWWPTWVKDYPKADQDRLLRLLFTDEGADLSIYRYNIPAGEGDSIYHPERRTPTIETAPGKYDFDADAVGIGYLRDIRALGVEHFVLFANSPPARLTINGLTSGGPNGGANLKEGAAGEFASYLADVTEHLKQELDLPHVTLSPINEPQWTWGRDWRGQEGCHYNPQQAAVAVRAVIDEVKRREMDVKIEAPESGAWQGSDRYAKALFSDPVIRETLDSLAVHSYWSGPNKKRNLTNWMKENYPEKNLAMTEYCEMRSVHDTGMEGALHMAKVMHEDLTIGSVVTWQWWLAIAAGGYGDSLIYASSEEKKIEVTRRLWVLGHYSRFVRPGYQRVGVGHEAGNVMASAYLSPDNDQLALVMTNPTDEQIHVKPVAKQSEYKAPTQYWVTDESVAMEEREAEAGVVVLPARSIATIALPRQTR